MRQLKGDDKPHFILHHLTWNQTKEEANGMRIVSQCKLRSGMSDKFQYDADLYLPYTDMEIGEPRFCFKKLIRYVAFPPEYKLMKVSWFKTDTDD